MLSAFAFATQFSFFFLYLSVSVMFVEVFFSNAHVCKNGNADADSKNVTVSQTSVRKDICQKKHRLKKKKKDEALNSDGGTRIEKNGFS